MLDGPGTTRSTSVHRPPNTDRRARLLAFPWAGKCGPGTRCSVADVDGAVALVGASLTVRIVRDGGCAHLVEALELVGRELDGCGAEVVGELVGVAHPQDHRGDGGLRLKPGKRHLPLIDPLGLRNLLDRVEDPPCPFLLVARCPRLHSALRILAQARGSCWVRVALVLAGEPAAGQR